MYISRKKTVSGIFLFQHDFVKYVTESVIELLGTYNGVNGLQL